VTFLVVQIFLLSERKVVNVCQDGDDEETLPCLKLTNLRWYEKFVEKVFRINPRFNIYLLKCSDSDSVSFLSIVPLSPSLQRIKVLCLAKCQKLEHVDLAYFPELRSLTIKMCDELKSVTGWEVVKEFGWLQISYCRSYEDFPPVQCLPSLREFIFYCGYESLALQTIPVPDLSQCIRLRRLVIWEIDSLALNSMDLSTLRFLEVLCFRLSCPDDHPGFERTAFPDRTGS
jgi:hypothetical protein